jgi:hypothetical protein
MISLEEASGMLTLVGNHETVSEMRSACGKHPNSVAPVVGVKGRSGIPAVFGVWGPGGPVCRFFVDEDSDARWSDRGVIEVEVAIELGPGRQRRIEAGTMK